MFLLCKTFGDMETVRSVENTIFDCVIRNKLVVKHASVIVLLLACPPVNVAQRNATRFLPVHSCDL